MELVLVRVSVSAWVLCLVMASAWGSGIDLVLVLGWMSGLGKEPVREGPLHLPHRLRLQ